jgi:hypothetical protein
MRLSTALGHVWQPTAQHQTVRMRCQLYEDCDADFFASQFRIATIIFPSQLPQPPSNGQAQQPEGFQVFHTPIEPVMGPGAPPSGFSSVLYDNTRSAQDPQPPRGLD